MKAGIVQKNIYSKGGILLLAKGQVLTRENLDKLRQIEIIEASTLTELGRQMALSWNKETRKAEFIPIDSVYMEHSSEMVSDMVLQYKEEPWWIFLNSLCEYADWVYVHSVDVALISGILASRLNFSVQDQQEICLGALLHDVGKLLVPREIIQKPGRLTEKEMAVVQNHSEFGYELLNDVGLPPRSLEIVLQHHERLDGSGYPYRLLEDRISPFSKIVMIADVLDAITSYRPYKEIGSMNIALQELRGNPSKYDQKIVKLLIDL